MGLRERDRTGRAAPEDAPAPRPADRLRRLLALVAALGALIAFTSLARPDPSPSSRLRIGDEQDDPGDDAAGGRPDGPPTVAAQALVRPLDPSTLADVPANLLALGQDEWTWPSEDGALLAVLDFSEEGGSGVRVVDAQTFQPVATLTVDGSLGGVHGFTPKADALVVQVGAPDRLTVERHPLDPEQEVTGVDLPADVETVGPRAALLTGDRLALVVAGRDPGEPQPGWSGVRVLVADLRAERLVVDLPLPTLSADFVSGAPRMDASLASPGFAWDTERERLYVAHADAARVTVVDLAAGAVLTEAEIGRPIADLGEEPVHRWRWAEVSPDGTRLYVAGREFRPAQGTSNPLGLSVIDTATLSEVEHVSLVDDWLQLSPDGRWLLWTKDEQGRASDPRGAQAPPRPALMDTAGIGLMTLVGGPDAFPLGFSRDSSRLYLQRTEAGQEIVTAYALPSLTRTGERRLARNEGFDPRTAHLREEH